MVIISQIFFTFVRKKQKDPNAMIFYFSGCGNSKYVAETIATQLNDTLIFIPEAARENRYDYTLSEGERLGFVFPVYAWAPPKLVLDFIQKLQLPTKPEYLYFACSCGDECGHTEKIFRKAIAEKGWELKGCFSVIMPETYIGMPGFKLDTDENARKKIDAAQVTMSRNIPRVLHRETFSDMVLGHFAWLKSYMINGSFNKFATDDRKYRATDKCIGCGKCVKVCPLQNISLEDNRPKWLGHCTMCMACYHHCPTNAIQYGKGTEGKGQYYFGK